MLFRKDYAFLEVLIGVISILIPILAVLILSPGIYNRGTVFAFAIFGVALGFAGGFAIIDGYYKLTDRLKFMEYEDFKKSSEKPEKE